MYMKVKTPSPSQEGKASLQVNITFWNFTSTLQSYVYSHNRDLNETSHIVSLSVEMALKLEYRKQIAGTS